MKRALLGLMVLAMGGLLWATWPLVSGQSPEAQAAQVAAREAEVVDSLGLPTEPATPDTVVAHPVPSVTPGEVPADVRRASFSVQVKDLAVPFGVMGLFVLPGEEVEIETLFPRAGATYTLTAQDGTIAGNEEGEWIWTAPDEPGFYPLQVNGPVDSITFHAFVMTPFRNGEPSLNRYRIGRYESRPLRGDAKFLPPRGLIEVNDETAAIRVSPNFTLGAFASHQPGQPRYMALDERLLIKLEMILEELQKEGVDVTTFTIMSGYRTPWYNASIGNTTKYSLHLFGRAADIFIDEDGDGRMDDLNGDGKVTKADAQYLYSFIDDLKESSWYQPFLGGMGLYGPKPHRGPFVHVDVRGYVARW